MYRLIPIILLCLLVGCKANEEKLIRKTLSDYKAAVLKDNGNEAVKYVDSQTIAYYQSLQEKAITLDSTDIERMRMMDKYQLILMKHLLKPEELRMMDGRKIFAFLIDSRTINKESVIKLNLGKIQIHENSAVAQMLINKNIAVGLDFLFYKEGSNWKLNIIQLFRIIEPYIIDLMTKNDIDEHTLYDLVGMELNGNFLNNSVWHPYK